VDVEVEVADGAATTITISGTARVVFTTQITLD